MTAVKAAGGIMLIVCGALAGLYASKRLKRRADFLTQYVIFLTRAETMISYCSSEIGEIISEPGDAPLLSHMLSVCCGMINSGSDFTAAWTSGVNAAADEGLLAGEDISLVRSFCDGFGTSGTEEEIAKLRLHREFIRQRASALSEEAARRQKLYRVVGTFCGAMAAAVAI